MTYCHYVTMGGPELLLDPVLASAEVALPGQSAGPYYREGYDNNRHRYQNKEKPEPNGGHGYCSDSY